MHLPVCTKIAELSLEYTSQIESLINKLVWLH